MTVANLLVALMLAQFVNSTVTAFMVTFAVCLVSFVPPHLTAITLSLAYSEAEAMGA
ncbi:MAG: hypothetical protein AAGA06_01525 [Pseudomonadota bacterium]